MEATLHTCRTGSWWGVPDDDFQSRGYDRNFGGQRGWRFGTSGKATY